MVVLKAFVLVIVVMKECMEASVEVVLLSVVVDVELEGQTTLGHFSARRKSDPHGKPPFANGTIIRLVEDRLPSPQDLEQTDHSDHWLN